MAKGNSKHANKSKPTKQADLPARNPSKSDKAARKEPKRQPVVAAKEESSEDPELLSGEEGEFEYDEEAFRNELMEMEAEEGEEEIDEEDGELDVDDGFIVPDGQEEDDDDADL